MATNAPSFSVWAIVICLVPVANASARAEPAISLEGQWEGPCERNGKVINASLIMDQLGARLNNKGVSNLKKGQFSVSFIEGEKRFSGTFSKDTSSLSGTLTRDGKDAKCSMTRKIASSDRLCIRNMESSPIFFRLDPGTNSTIRLQANQETNITGDRNGKLCWDVNDFGKDKCPRSLPQSSYAC